MLISLFFVIVCFWLWLHGAFPPKDPPNQQTAIEERGFESNKILLFEVNYDIFNSYRLVCLSVL